MTNSGYEAREEALADIYNAPKSITIIGDVHGCYKTLMALIEQLPANEPLCFVGDLIDRGPQSADVVEFVKSNNHYCVLGNHEEMMINAEPYWDYNGGGATTRSYNGDTDLYHQHLEWMQSLPAYLEFHDLNVTTDRERHLVVSHSSIARYWQTRDTSTEDILWNRDVTHGTLPSSNSFFNVFGHSIMKKPLITSAYADIDTGCVYNQHGYSTLTALQFPSMKVYTQPNIED